MKIVFYKGQTHNKIGIGIKRKRERLELCRPNRRILQQSNHHKEKA